MKAILIVLILLVGSVLVTARQAGEDKPRAIQNHIEFVDEAAKSQT